METTGLTEAGYIRLLVTGLAMAAGLARQSVAMTPGRLVVQVVRATFLAENLVAMTMG